MDKNLALGVKVTIELSLTPAWRGKITFHNRVRLGI